MKTFQTGDMSFGGVDTSVAGDMYSSDSATSYFALLLSTHAEEPVDYNGDPMGTFFYPVFASFDKNDRSPVAVLFTVFKWSSYFEELLPPNGEPISIILENSCDGSFSYLVEGSNVTYVGKGDQHDIHFDYMEHVVDLTAALSNSTIGLELNSDICSYSLRIYPTERMYNAYNSDLPVVIAASLAVVFAFAVLLFHFYNLYVERRQKLMRAQAAHATAVVSSLFPEGVRDRLMKNHSEGGLSSKKKRLSTFLNDEEDPNDDGEPIADLFPNCTGKPIHVCGH